jgi:hypothetical protein
MGLREGVAVEWIVFFLEGVAIAVVLSDNETLDAPTDFLGDFRGDCLIGKGRE